MSDELLLLLAGRVVGSVRRAARQRLSLTYRAEWRETHGAFPVSLSLPLAAAVHAHPVVTAYLWGLLPENPLVLDRWARTFQTSAASAFDLLAHVGEDCPGAVQLVRPERIEILTGAHATRTDWLSEAEVADRLRALREDAAAWRKPSDVGRFSLAGAQPKTALLYERGRFGVPSGRTPTTHILKPPIAGLEGHAKNEHVCLVLANALGLASATSEVRRFGEELAIVVERYDRARSGGSVVRIHQEDLCQALGLMPSAKYQSEGGPSPHDLVDLLRTHSSRADEDVPAFLDALIFNWLIAGTDAHAKNYSVLLGSAGRVRLAPLYDLSSALPYGNVRKLKLAMKLGNTYRVHDVGLAELRKLAREVDVADDWLIERARQLAKALPEALAKVTKEAKRTGLGRATIDGLAKVIEANALRCARALQK